MRPVPTGRGSQVFDHADDSLVVLACTPAASDIVDKGGDREKKSEEKADEGDSEGGEDGNGENGEE